MVAVAGAGYGLLGALVRWGHRSLLYPAPKRRLAGVPRGAELAELLAADGAPVQALVFPAGGARTIVYFHGNGETIADLLPLAQLFVARGFGFALCEYRGYGGSPAADPSEDGLYADAEAVIAAVRERGHGPGDVVLWGSSLGTGVATEMALRGHGCRLVLAAPFTSIPDVATRWAPFLPMNALIADRFDNLAKAARLAVPTLILHGDDDRVVPYDMGVTLASRIPGAELVTIPGGGHNDLFARDPRLVDRVASYATG